MTQFWTDWERAQPSTKQLTTEAKQKKMKKNKRRDINWKRAATLSVCVCSSNSTETKTERTRASFVGCLWTPMVIQFHFHFRFQWCVSVCVFHLLLRNNFQSQFFNYQIPNSPVTTYAFILGFHQFLRNALFPMRSTVHNFNFVFDATYPNDNDLFSVTQLTEPTFPQ